jgi:hypothetical protein
MADDLDFLWRPILKNLCKMESLNDGSLDLIDIAEAHDALDIEAENQRRADAAMRRR